MKFDKILADVGQYYTEKINAHGTTAKGVDWNSEDSQRLRFEQLLKVAGTDEEFTLMDYGCGYGSLYDYIKSKYAAVEYAGYDISEEMLKNAKRIHDGERAIFTDAIDFADEYDYAIASGIFNVKLSHSENSWEEYVAETIDTMNLISNKGFAFNILTKYSDKEFMRDNLYYADPCFWFDFCKQKYSKYVSLLHDYPLYEFTILVKKY